MRRKRNYKREINPDIKYDSPQITKFINNLMYQGNKSTIEKFVYEALDAGSKELGMNNPLEFFTTAIQNIMINFELRSRRVGGATYQVPRPLDPERSFRKTIKFITGKIKEEKGTSLDKKIIKIFIDACNKTGNIYHTYNSMVNSVEANKVNAVYRW